MKLKSLLLGTSLSLIPNLTYAQCSPAQSCAELGYKETDKIGGCLKSHFVPELTNNRERTNAAISINPVPALPVMNGKTVNAK